MRNRWTLFWHICLPFLLVCGLGLGAVAWYTTASVKELIQEKDFADLRVQAAVIANIVSERFSPDRFPKIDAALKGLAPTLQSRLTAVLSSGEVIADSHEELSRVDDLSARPEIREAFKGKSTAIERFSFRDNAAWAYVTVPLVIDGRVVGAVRAARPSADTNLSLKQYRRSSVLGGVMVLLLVAAAGLYVANRIKKPLAEIRGGVARFAEGDLRERLDADNWKEFGALADTIYAVAAKLQDRINSVTAQRNELEAVLSSMVEGVLVIDNHERILRINQAAETLFQLDEAKVRGRLVHEAIRNTDLHRFIDATLSGEDPVEREIAILGDPDVFLRAHGVTVRDALDLKIGALVVLHDVTRLKKLENIRRDFVANVSHELKTPVTSIRGFLETLKEGAIHDPENATRFLDILIRQTERLDMILEDLLSLSRIERDGERGEIVLEHKPLKDVIDAVGKSCSQKAQAKNIALEFDVEGHLVGRINPTLLEQAVVNLVENAIKYSDPNKTVQVQARKTNGEIAIQVKDQGCGIAKEHLGRIFERFYRVDKGRSRKEGGTGLGLSIVRHIVNAHGGRVTVESSPGRGSTFSVYLPSAV